MNIWRSADIKYINGWVVKNILMVAVDFCIRQPVMLFLFFSFLRVDINKGDNLAAVRKFKIALNVIVGNITGSNNGNSLHCDLTYRENIQ
ncbi:hypothetical protein D3C75_764570 [compost metagenome]